MNRDSFASLLLKTMCPYRPEIVARLLPLPDSLLREGGSPELSISLLTLAVASDYGQAHFEISHTTRIKAAEAARKLLTCLPINIYIPTHSP